MQITSDYQEVQSPLGERIDGTMTLEDETTSRRWLSR